MEELDRAIRRGIDDRIVYFLGHRDCPHRLRAVGERLGHRDDIRRYAECLRGKIVTGAAESGDHFIEYENNSVRIADLADPFEIALRRDETAGRAGDGLDEACGDVFSAVEIDEARKIFGKLDAVRA